MSSVLSAQQPAQERLSVVESYFEQLAPSDLLVAHDVASKIADKGPLADTVVIIPVAAHQEAPQIANTLGQYARQRVDRPFSVVLGLNCPEDKTNDASTQATIAEVDAAQKRHPSLDVRTTFKPYEQPVIGQIRRDLWNGVLQSALDNDQIGSDKTVVGLNQDIDLISMRPTALSTLQAEYNYQAKQGLFLTVTGMQMTHGVSPQHPNIGRVVQWGDFTNRQAGGTFESGLVIPAEMYANAGGFDGDASIGEAFTRVKSPHYIVRGTHAITSPRRYIERMQTDGLAIWNEETFSANDLCRTSNDFPDISRERSIELIDEGIFRVAQQLGNRVISGTMSDLRMLKSKQPKLYERVMEDTYFLEKAFDRRLSRKRTVSARALDVLTGSRELGEKMTLLMTMDIPRMAENIRNAALKTLKPGQKTIVIEKC